MTRVNTDQRVIDARFFLKSARLELSIADDREHDIERAEHNVLYWARSLSSWETASETLQIHE